MKNPEPCPVTAPRPRGVPRKPGGMPSGEPKRRKNRSIGEPGWNGVASSLLPLSSLVSFSLMLTFTEITDGFTRSTISAKPTGFCTLLTSLLTCACAALPKISAGPMDGLKPYAPTPRPAATEAINANLRNDDRERRTSVRGGRDERSVGRSFMQNLQH